MKNAHERRGKLAYVRRTEKTATNIRALLDAFVGEEGGKAHLISAVRTESGRVATVSGPPNSLITVISTGV